MSKMELVDLPLELIQAIMAETVWLVGLHQAAHLRLVSKMFDTQIQRAIYALPTFDSVTNHMLPEAFRLPKSIHPSMTARLILSKMDAKESEKRPLCLAITRAIAYLDNNFEQKGASLHLEFIEALAGAASRTLTLRDIAECLVTTPTVLVGKLQKAREDKFRIWRAKHPGRDLPRFPIEHLTPSSDSYIDSTPQDALIATLCTRKFELAIKLLGRGVMATTKSPAFGVPLQVAAAIGAQGFVRIALDRLMEQDKNGAKNARQFVLQGAAAGGHEHIVRMILDNPEDNRERLGKGLSRSIILAVENGHRDVALLLLQHRAPIPPRGYVRASQETLERRELEFWRDLSRKAAHSGCEDVLRIALESAAGDRHEIDKPLEQAHLYPDRA